MNGALSTAVREIRTQKPLWLSVAAAVVVGYYALQLAAVSVGLQQVPNYIVWYDYVANLQRIFAGTPSLTDALRIMQDEWLIETGHMSYDYGNGVALWSLNVQPMRLILMALAGAGVATCVVLLRAARRSGATAWVQSAGIVSVAAGILLVAVSNATLSWVVACISPSWIATLHMIGIDGNVVNALEPFGRPIAIAGFVLLASAVCGLSWRHARASRQSHPPHQPATQV